jgi:ankyrin repeat protein
LETSIAYHATHDQEGKLMRVLRSSHQMPIRHHESQFEAMTYACAAGFGNLIQWLIALRVDPDIRSSEPAKDSELKRQSVISPLMAAAQRNDPTFLTHFLRHFVRPTGYSLHEVMCMLFGFPEYIKDHAGAVLLVDSGLDHKIIDPDGTTTLHYAAAHYSGEEVRFLVTHGVDIDAQAVGGATPLAYAITVSNVDTIQALLDLGADANQ